MGYSLGLLPGPHDPSTQRLPRHVTSLAAISHSAKPSVQPKLCKRCLDAKKWGEYRYRCRGCGVKMRGQLQDLGRLLKMSFCQNCMTSYYGRYDPENPALIHVLAARVVKQKKQKRYYDS